MHGARKVLAFVHSGNPIKHITQLLVSSILARDVSQEGSRNKEDHYRSQRKTRLKSEEWYDVQSVSGNSI